MFSQLGSLLSDVEFWGGVGEGFTKEALRQEDSKAKDVRELRNFGIERGLQISEENSNSIKESEASITNLASLIAGKRNINDAAVKEAAYVLVSKAGSVSAAATLAQDLNTQYKTYGRDPINALGYTDASFEGRDTPTYSQLAKKFTKIKPLPNLGSNELENLNEMTALDRIFGGKSTTQLAQEGVSSFLGEQISATDDAIPVALTTDMDEDLILGSNINNELTRMYTLQSAMDMVSEDQQDASFTSRRNAISANIAMLKTARSKIKEKTSMTLGERNTQVRLLSDLLQSSAGLKGQWDPVTNAWIPAYKQDEIFGISKEAGNLYADALNWAYENGANGMNADGGDVDPYTFIRTMAELGNYVEIVKATDVAPGYLIKGEKVYDTTSSAFQSAMATPTATTNATTNSGGGGGGNTPNVTVGQYTPSARVASLVPTLTAQGSTKRTRTASADAIMSSIKQQQSGLTQADYDAIFKAVTGMTYQEATK
jgi:hypothetical protein